jgi:uncharacterized protein
MNTDYEVLLLPLFEDLRSKGLPLGLPEYLLAVQTLREGIGLEDAEALRRVCCLLWAKSRAEQEAFHIAFDKLVQPHLETALPVPEISFVPTLPDEYVRDSWAESQDDWPESSPEVTAGQPETNDETYYHVPLDGMLPPALRDTLPQKRFPMMPQLSVNTREMFGQWQQLRQMRREGPYVELDVEATVRDICRFGVFRGPLWRPPRSNQAKLLLLIDQRGSMAPFALLIDAFLKSVTSGGQVAKTSVYYFHNCPYKELYAEPRLVTPHKLEKVLAQDAQYGSVLIVSDAGAARGYYDQMRLEETKKFLKTLHTYTYLYAWINPVPVYRWDFTTAEEIAQLIPMYPLDHEGLEDAIAILRGQPFPRGVNAL